MLRKFVIERDIRGIGREPVEALCAAAKKSNDVLYELAPGIQWLHSYVTADKTFCVYLAEGAALIREHARRSGFPADRVSEVVAMLDPTAAPTSPDRVVARDRAPAEEPGVLSTETGRQS